VNPSTLGWLDGQRVRLRDVPEGRREDFEVEVRGRRFRPLRYTSHDEEVLVGVTPAPRRAE